MIVVMPRGEGGVVNRLGAILLLMLMLMMMIRDRREEDNE